MHVLTKVIACVIERKTLKLYVCVWDRHVCARVQKIKGTRRSVLYLCSTTSEVKKKKKEYTCFFHRLKERSLASVFGKAKWGNPQITSRISCWMGHLYLHLLGKVWGYVNDTSSKQCSNKNVYYNLLWPASIFQKFSHVI